MKKYKFRKAKLVIARRISRIKMPNISYLVFFVCILLFMLSLLTTAFQRTPIYSIVDKSLELPYELQLYGNVNSDEDILIYVGGYKCNVDNDGNFNLDFVTESKESILVCFVSETGTVLFSSIVSYCSNEWSKELDINLEKE